MRWVGYIVTFLLLLEYTDAQPGEALENEKSEIAWAQIKIGLNDLFAGKPIRFHRSTALRNMVHSCCPNTNVMLPTAIKTNPNITNACKSLYDRLQQYLQNIVDNVYKKAAELRGEDFLKYYVSQFNSYAYMYGQMPLLFDYMDNNWVAHEHAKGNLNVLRSFHLAKAIWEQRMVAHVRNKIMAEILILILRERNGEEIDAKLIKDAIIVCGHIRHYVKTDNPEARFCWELFERVKENYLEGKTARNSTGQEI